MVISICNLDSPDTGVSSKTCMVIIRRRALRCNGRKEKLTTCSFPDADLTGIVSTKAFTIIVVDCKATYLRHSKFGQAVTESTTRSDDPFRRWRSMPLVEGKDGWHEQEIGRGYDRMGRKHRALYRKVRILLWFFGVCNASALVS